DYLLRELIASLDRDIDAIRRCAAGLEHDRVARSLAEEALGNARGHRQSIQEVLDALASKA
ncbi:MAG: hypothetical protein K8T25_21430, partial [Planctomycetia bacterium]|nr:hypothetical protein [Planctomycetia bacterium]